MPELLFLGLHRGLAKVFCSHRQRLGWAFHVTPLPLACALPAISSVPLVAAEWKPVAASSRPAVMGEDRTTDRLAGTYGHEHPDLLILISHRAIMIQESGNC